MLRSLAWLALEAKYLDRARSFYEGPLGLDPVRQEGGAVAYRTGPTALVLRAPGPVPRGGLHVHYAFSTPSAASERWADRLADHDPETASFGSYRSLYVDDPDDHCVEVGNNGDEEADPDGSTAPLTGVFEVVLEVESLDRAEAFYGALGFEVVDRGDDRRRVRMRGPFDLELWEPQLGLADARGGVHVDLGFAVADPAAAAAAVEDRALDVARVSETGLGAAVAADVATDADEAAVRVRDPDGHYLTFVAAE